MHIKISIAVTIVAPRKHPDLFNYFSKEVQNHDNIQTLRIESYLYHRKAFLKF